VALAVALAWISPTTSVGQTSKPYTEPLSGLKGTETTSTSSLANGHTQTIVTHEVSGVDTNGNYVRIVSSSTEEKDRDGNYVKETSKSTVTKYDKDPKEGGQQTSVETYKSTDTYDAIGGVDEVWENVRVNKKTGETVDTHTEEHRDARGVTSGHQTKTTSVPGEKPVKEEFKFDPDKGWQKVSLSRPEQINAHPGHLASGTTGGAHHAKQATGLHGAATHAKRTASMYLSGTIVSLEGCEGTFYKSFPKVGSTQNDYGAVSVKGGVFEFDGSSMQYDPYTGKLMADGNFQLTSSQSAGSTIDGTILPDNTISGTWHKVYDSDCSYTVKLVRGKGTSGSSVSVTRGGSWRLALSGSHQ